MLARSGMNSAGIGLCGNFLNSDFDGTQRGVPIPIVRRAILMSPSLPFRACHAPLVNWCCFRLPEPSLVGRVEKIPTEIGDEWLLAGHSQLPIIGVNADVR